MDDHRIVAVEPEHSDLQRCPVAGRPDQHRQVFAHVDLVRRVADAMPDVGVRKPVFPRWLTDPHIDNLPCLIGTWGTSGRAVQAATRRYRYLLCLLVDRVPPGTNWRPRGHLSRGWQPTG